MAHEVTLIGECGEKWNCRSEYCCLIHPLFRVQLSWRAWFCTSHKLNVLSYLLTADLQRTYHVAHLQHRSSSKPQPHFLQQAIRQRSLWSEASTDQDVHAPLPLLWNNQESFLQERQSDRSMVSYSLLHSFLLPVPSLAEDLFVRWKCCLRFLHQALNTRMKQISTVVDTNTQNITNNTRRTIKHLH